MLTLALTLIFLNIATPTESSATTEDWRILLDGNQAYPFITRASENRTLIAGRFEGRLKIGKRLIGNNKSSESDVFAIMVNSKGHILWTRTWATPQIDRICDAAFSDDGSLWFLLARGKTSRTTFCNRIEKLSAKGKTLKKFKTEGIDTGRYIFSLPENRLMVVGHLLKNETPCVDSNKAPCPRFPTYQQTLSIATYDEKGKIIRALRATNEPGGKVEASVASYDPASDILYLSGSFKGDVSFGQVGLKSTTAKGEHFLAAIKAGYTTRWVRKMDRPVTYEIVGTPTGPVVCTLGELWAYKNDGDERWRSKSKCRRIVSSADGVQVSYTDGRYNLFHGKLKNEDGSLSKRVPLLPNPGSKESADRGSCPPTGIAWGGKLYFGGMLGAWSCGQNRLVSRLSWKNP